MINSSVGEAGAAILQSIREHLAESALCHAPIEEAKSALTATESSIEPDPAVPEDGHKNHADHSAVEMFRERLEADAVGKVQVEQDDVDMLGRQYVETGRELSRHVQLEAQ